MERQNPLTSIKAYESIKQGDMRETHWLKIKKALEVLKAANYEEIARQCGIDKVAVNRRLSELLRMKMVFKAGYTLPTSSGHAAQVYQLQKPNSEPENKPIEGKNIVDFSNLLITTNKQQDLFGNNL